MWRHRLSKHREVELAESLVEQTTVEELDRDFETFMESSNSIVEQSQPESFPMTKIRSQTSARSKGQDSVSLLFRGDGSLMQSSRTGTNNSKLETSTPLTREDSLDNESIVRARSVLNDLEKQLKSAKKKGRSVDRKQLLVALLSFIDSIEEREVIQKEIRSLKGEPVPGDEPVDDSTATASYDDTLDGGSTLSGGNDDGDDSTKESESGIDHRRRGSSKVTRGSSRITQSTYDDDDDDSALLDGTNCAPCVDSLIQDEGLRAALNDILFIEGKNNRHSQWKGSNSMVTSTRASTCTSFSTCSKDLTDQAPNPPVPENPSNGSPIEMKKSRSWWRQLKRSKKQTSKKKTSKKSGKPDNDLPTAIVVRNKSTKLAASQSASEKDVPERVDEDPARAPSENDELERAVAYYLFSKDDSKPIDNSVSHTETHPALEDLARHEEQDAAEGVQQPGNRETVVIATPTDNSKQQREAPPPEDTAPSENPCEALSHQHNDKDLAEELEDTSRQQSFPFLGRSTRAIGRSFSRGRSLQRSLSPEVEIRVQDTAEPSGEVEGTLKEWRQKSDETFEDTFGIDDPDRGFTRKWRARSISRRRSSADKAFETESAVNTEIMVSNDDSVSSWNSTKHLNPKSMDPTKIEVVGNVGATENKRKGSVGNFIKKRLSKTHSRPRLSASNSENDPSIISKTDKSRQGRASFRRRFRRSKKELVCDSSNGDDDSIDFGQVDARPARITVRDYSFTDGLDASLDSDLEDASIQNVFIL